MLEGNAFHKIPHPLSNYRYGYIKIQSITFLEYIYFNKIPRSFSTNTFKISSVFILLDKSLSMSRIERVENLVGSIVDLNQVFTLISWH